MMRLTFATADHRNTRISDERGYVYYDISTPAGMHKVTTITKYNWIGGNGRPETYGVIEWHRWQPTVFRFGGKVMTVDEIFEKRAWENGRHFLGPDRKVYKWKLETTHCWMRAAESHAQLVRFHKKNFGIMKPPHPAYLDVSPKVAPILDHIILTFVYIEQLRQEQERERQQRVAMGNNRIMMNNNTMMMSNGGTC